ncbi:FAS1 domain-containing protein [Stipitochalara longipes BDJ]|nr:FAS1 domain-containing protein [Stipitochalara longipes BDJ]
MASLKSRQNLPSSIIPTIESYGDLNTLVYYVNNSTKLYNLLNTAKNFTFFAPTNVALANWIHQTQGNKTPSSDIIEATLSYHILNGSWPTVEFKDAPQFVATSLTNASYANVTVYPSGQRVELVESGGSPEILSNNKTVTTISAKDIVCLNGLIQIVNSVFSIPAAVVNLVADANMSYLIAILNKANVNHMCIVDFVNYASFTPNTTFFLPNTQAALDWFESISPSMSADNLTALFNYHIIPNTLLYSPDFVNGTVLQTHQGDTLTMTRVGSDVYLNSAKILQTDYLIANGVVHTLDSLLMPFNQTIIAQPSSTTTTSASSSSASQNVSTNKGLSTGAKVAIGVVIPLVFLAALAGIFWFWRKRKGIRTKNEMDGSAAMREMDANLPPKELNGADRKKDYDTRYAPQELAGGVNSLPPVELG